MGSPGATGRGSELARLTGWLPAQTEHRSHCRRRDIVVVLGKEGKKLISAEMIPEPDEIGREG